MKFSEAKSLAETEGTEKSKKFRKTARNVIIALTAIVVLVVLTYMVAGRQKMPERQKKSAIETPSKKIGIPLVSQPVSDWPKLVLPPGGKSERIPVPPGMRVKIKGEDFRFHCVYRDGKEISFGKGEKACPDGDMPFVYASNERTAGENVLVYAYMPK